jgi:hypothetical protein
VLLISRALGTTPCLAHRALALLSASLESMGRQKLLLLLESLQMSLVQGPALRPKVTSSLILCYHIESVEGVALRAAGKLLHSSLEAACMPWCS